MVFKNIFVCGRLLLFFSEHVICSVFSYDPVILIIIFGFVIIPPTLHVGPAICSVCSRCSNRCATL